MSKDSSKKENIFKYLNKPILFLTLFFAIGGSFLILDASSISSVLTYGFDTPYYYFIRQIIFIGLALVASFVVIKFFPTKTYKGVSVLLILFFLGALLVAYLKNKLFSSNVNVVTLSLFGGVFQPAEFLKVFLYIFVASLIDQFLDRCLPVEDGVL